VRVQVNLHRLHHAPAYPIIPADGVAKAKNQGAAGRVISHALLVEKFFSTYKKLRIHLLKFKIGLESFFTFQNLYPKSFYMERNRRFHIG
jgi:hypothetical protein